MDEKRDVKGGCESSGSEGKWSSAEDSSNDESEYVHPRQLLQIQRRKDKDKKYRANQTDKPTTSCDRMRNHRRAKAITVTDEEASAAKAANRDRMRGVRQSQRARSSFNPSAPRCPHCKTGDCTVLTSCPMYCSYCSTIGHNRLLCPKEVADIRKATNMNADAANYKRAIEQTMVFYTCAVCEIEAGLDSLSKLEDVQDIISNSGIKVKYEAMIGMLNDESASSQEKAYAAAAHAELADGLLRSARHVCNTCIGQMRAPVTTGTGATEAAGLSGGLVPDKALVNGYFRGACPPELTGLTRTDISLITIINIFVTVSMLQEGGHWGTQGTVFSVMNDVVEIAQFMPSNPTPAQHAIIRKNSTSTPRDYRYNPYRVLQALKWLEENNHLYAGKTAASVVLTDGTLDPNWINGGVDAELEPEHIIAEDADMDGVEEKDKEAPAGEDGHAVNPGAPASSMTEVLLQGGQTYANNVHQMDAIVNKTAPPVVTIRQYGEFVSDFDVDDFMAKSFPVLYPYGKGSPNNTGIKFDKAYISHMLHLGGARPFQQSPSFIFYCYAWVQRSRTGSIAYQASKHDNGDREELSVDAVKEFLQNLKDNPTSAGITTAEQRRLLNRLQPYATQIPGTELYFEKERKNLISMITSPVTNTHGQWTWFYTEAQPDKYLVEIFDNAITSARGSLGVGIDASLELRRSASDNLSASARTDILRDHPFLSARIHGLQQQAFWEFVLNGEDKPLGEIADYWLRAEFQMKGTPHWHSLINIKKSSMVGIDKLSVESKDPIARQNVLDFVQAASTNELLAREPDDLDQLPDNYTRLECAHLETYYDFNVDRTKYFNDVCHPARHRFEAAGVDYSMDSVSGKIHSAIVRKIYRKLQIANQLHSCRKSCWKYCRPGTKQRCRYDFPRKPLPGNDIGPVIVEDKDKRNRARVKVHPTRNNGNINTCVRSPVCVLAMRGNHDIQYIHNVRGGAEYCSKYASKAEAAETTALQNAISRKLAQYVQNNSALPNLHGKLSIVANAVIEAQQVGTVQACYILGNQKLIVSSRTYVHINTLKRCDFTLYTVITDENDLDAREGTSSALVDKPSTQLGRRDAFHVYMKYQHDTYGEREDYVTFYAFAVAFTLSTLTTKRKHRPLPERVLVDSDGFVANAKTFVLGEVVYVAMKKKPVICLTPQMPIDETKEASAYMVLLMYSNWGVAGEASILQCDNSPVSAVEKLRGLKEQLPDFVLKSLKQRSESEALLANSGETVAETDELVDVDVEEDTDPQAGTQVRRTHAGTIIGVAPHLGTERFVRNIAAENVIYYQNYVSGIKQTHREHFETQHRLTNAEVMEKFVNPLLHYDIPNVDAQRDALDVDVGMLNVEQRNAYDIAVEHISGSCGKQLIMFLSGEGGTGKSKVIHTITLYTRILFGKTEGDWGAVLKTAPTGGAAHNIGGSTWHSALGNNGTKKLKTTDDISDASIVSLQMRAKGTVLYILDELSLTSCDNLFEISRRLGAATGKPDLPFGGLHVILAGDFYQMKTLNGIPLVQSKIPTSNKEAVLGRKLFVERMTHFCELVHNVRAQLQAGVASPLATFVKHARIGDVSVANGVCMAINTRVVNTQEVAMRCAAPDAIWITSTHDKIANINGKFKRENLRKGLRMVKVIARHTPRSVDTPSPSRDIRTVLYSEKGSRNGSRSDLMVSYMNLFVGTRVRIIRNLFVEGGLYNGAMGTVWGFAYRGSGPSAATLHKQYFGDMEDDEREIPIVLVQMDGEDNSISSCSPTVPRLVPICEVLSQGLVKGEYHRHQLPILPAQARTAHSVQGYTARAGVVVEPGSQFFAGDYTAISRATDMEKVILLRPVVPSDFDCLTKHSDYQLLVAEEYKRLRTKFQLS